MKLFFAICLMLWASVATAQGTLVLLVDASTSIKSDDVVLQMSSYQNAMSQLSILSGVNIEVIIFNDQVTHISSGSRQNAATAFGNLLENPLNQQGATCLTSALQYVETLMPLLPQPVVIDISGDGQDNCSKSNGQLHPTLDRLADQGAVVNTLLIANEAVTARGFSQQQAFAVMTRNGGFSIVAEDFYDFENSLFEKLTIEVSNLKEQYNDNTNMPRMQDGTWLQ